MYIDVKKNLWFVGLNSRTSVLDLYLPQSNEKVPLLIFCHGFKGFKDWGHFPLICNEIAKQGIAVLSFNFSHNGGTPEEPIDFPDLKAFSENTYSKEIGDIEHILKWLELNAREKMQYVDTERISILGHSRGGGIVLLAASKYRKLRKVITWAAVSDFEARLPNEESLKKWETDGVHYVMNGRTKQNMPMSYGFVEDLIENREQLKIQTAVEKMAIPQLIIHGSEDETVKVKEANSLSSWNPKAVVRVIKDANHVFNGKHPWEQTELPKATIEAIEETVSFIKP